MEGDLAPAPALERAQNGGAVAAFRPFLGVRQSLLEALEPRADVCPRCLTGDAEAFRYVSGFQAGDYDEFPCHGPSPCRKPAP